MTRDQFLHLLPTQVAIEAYQDTLQVIVDDSPLNLKKSLKVENHSATGFNWGNAGSGAAQFSLALLMRFVDELTARKYYQQLKSGWVATLPKCTFKKEYNLRQIMIDIFKRQEEHEIL